jgi:hypothetical protein
MSDELEKRTYPNVKVRLRVARTGPALPPREHRLLIWLKGSRFRIRDESGRHISDILNDLPGENGLGTTPRSLEAMMDAWSISQRPAANARDATELYGDLETGDGVVKRGNQKPWSKEASELAPIAEQILADETGANLEVVHEVTKLGKTATELHGFLEGTAEGSPFKTEITQIVAAPYLLLSEASDASGSAHSLTREIESLEEGVVTDNNFDLPT